MNLEHGTNGMQEPVSGPSANGVKADLLAWAEDCDAQKARARSSVGALATRGALAVLGGIVIARVLTARGRGSDSRSNVESAGTKPVTWALLVRAGTWLLPYALTALQSHMDRRASTRPLHPRPAPPPR